MLEHLRHITQEVNLASDMQESLRIMVQQVCSVLKVEVCSVYLADYNSHQFTLVATEGLNPKAIGVVRLGFTEGLVGLVAQREEPINLQDVSRHPNYLYFPQAGEEQFASFLGVPVIHQRKVLGVLVIQQKASRKFSNNEETFLITLSAQIAGAIASAESVSLFSGPAQGLEVRRLEGLPVSTGIAIGAATVVYASADLSSVPDKQITDIEFEVERFQQALRAAQNEVVTMKERMTDLVSQEELALFDAYYKLLSDNSLGNEVVGEIAKGQWAPGALRRVVEKHVGVFESMDDPYLRERASDLKDLARNVLLHLEDNRAERPTLDSESVIVADEITASMLAEIPSEHLLGIVSLHGSPSSHAAIIAKALGIPAVIGFHDIPIHRFEGKHLIIDGYNGHVYLSPSEALEKQYQRLIREEMKLTQELEQQLHQPSITTDDVHYPLFVNIGLMADFEKSVQARADGVGLYRTEIPFLLRERFPSEAEQIQIYRSALEAFRGKSVTIRTLDIGGDKQLPYFPIDEDNPFLGWRGIRVTLDHPEIMLVQVRAILKASFGIQGVRIALPMISTIEEIDAAQRLIRQAYYEVQEENPEAKELLQPPQVGIVLEVPSAIYQIHNITSRVDFISVGSNDLTQYLMAVDRNNAQVSSLFSNFQPALIMALKQICDACDENNTPNYICGEMAGDPIATILLVGLGFKGLSMNARSLPKVKKIINNISQKEAKECLEEVLKMERAKDIHAYLFEKIESKGLGGLIRAGK
ncbi:phosphoenolpyruvate--protein phosphotransferase [Pleionea sp. CnH1-48]|uniref:phosphoenolpyruvate--protein phosphotransferase n=1 Tax=Pleionea sp. CnH1-48 TaxID=2954494 RepID=UPI0020969F74|nr:phosphoenolpyruvate--protein phosphotransferase [Pleionea sp. CnH1-48]MCO7225151.1 phosphoenolpyruvate--protein phosphotransferase [Pleionea sp. CnH1-48]